MSNTRTAIWKEILDRYPFLGFYATADAVGTTYVEDDSEFGASNLGPGQYKDLYIWRYQLSGNDRVKLADEVTPSTGRLSVADVNNYSDTTDTSYALVSVHPDAITRAIINAQRKIRVKRFPPLTILTDGDMQTTGVAYWDGTSGSSAASNTTPTKTTSDVFEGTQALLLTASGTSGYVRSEQFKVNPGQQIYTAALFRADVGTVGLRFYDATNAANFGTQVTHTGEEWAVATVDTTVPSGCELAHVQLDQVGATDVGVVQAIFGPYLGGRRIFTLQSWLDENWEIKALRPARFGYSISNNLYDAQTREFYGDLVQPQDFELLSIAREVVPARLQMRQSLPREPIWISAERELFDYEPLATESATSSADLDQLIAYAMVDLLENTILPANEDTRYRVLLNEFKGKTAVETLVRPSQPLRPARRWHVVRA